MTAREIVKKRMNHIGTNETPYTLSIESNLTKRLNEYYGNEDWQDGLLRKYIVSYLDVDTVRLERMDDIHSRDALGAVWQMDKHPWHIQDNPLAEPTLKGYRFSSSDYFVKPILKNKQDAIKKHNADSER